MPSPSQFGADCVDGSSLDRASGKQFAAQLRKTLNTIPAYTWYALPSGVLTFVNEGYADYIANGTDFDCERAVDQLRSGAREMDPKSSGLYLRYHLLVAHLLTREQGLDLLQAQWREVPRGHRRQVAARALHPRRDHRH